MIPAYMLFVIKRSKILADAIRISEEFLGKYWKDNLDYTINKIIKYVNSQKFLKKIYPYKIESLEDIIERLPISTFPPSYNDLPFVKRIFSIRLSTSGTTRKKEIAYSPLMHEPMSLIIAAFIKKGIYKPGRKMFWIDSGYTETGIPYGTLAIRKIMELSLSSDFTGESFMNHNNLIAKIQKKFSGNLDGMIIFAPFLERYLGIIKDKRINLREPFFIGWTGDIIFKDDIEKILEILDNKGIQDIFIANFYGAVEGPFLGYSGTLKLRSNINMEDLRTFVLPNMLLIPLFKDIKNGGIITQEKVKCGENYEILINTYNIIPILKYTLKDIVKIKGLRKEGISLEIIGRGMFPWGDGYTGSYLRIRGYTINTKVLVDFLEEILGKLSLILIYHDRDVIKMVIYADKKKEGISIINSILDINKEDIRSSLSGLITLYKANLMEIKVRDYNKGIEISKELKYKYKKIKIPKVIYFRERMPLCLN